VLSWFCLCLRHTVGPHLYSGIDSANLNYESRALIKFDVASIAASFVNATEVSVKLYLTTSPASGATAIGLYRVARSWTEGSANPSYFENEGTSPGLYDPTWRSNSWGFTSWNSPGTNELLIPTVFSSNQRSFLAVGGDYISQYSSSLTVYSSGWVTFSGPQLLADVQAWLSGTPNYGWGVITGAGTTGSSFLSHPSLGWLLCWSNLSAFTDFLAFYSKDSAYNAKPPQLVISYPIPPAAPSPPPVPTTASPSATPVPTPAPRDSITPSPADNSTAALAGTIVGGVIGALVLILAILVVIWLIIRQQRSNKRQSPPPAAVTPQVAIDTPPEKEEAPDSSPKAKDGTTYEVVEVGPPAVVAPVVVVQQQPAAPAPVVQRPCFNCHGRNIHNHTAPNSGQCSFCRGTGHNQVGRVRPFKFPSCSLFVELTLFVV